MCVNVNLCHCECVCVCVCVLGSQSPIVQEHLGVSPGEMTRGGGGKVEIVSLGWGPETRACELAAGGLGGLQLGGLGCGEGKISYPVFKQAMLRVASLANTLPHRLGVGWGGRCGRGTLPPPSFRPSSTFLNTKTFVSSRPAYARTLGSRKAAQPKINRKFSIASRVRIFSRKSAQSRKDGRACTHTQDLDLSRIQASGSRTT